MIKRMVALFALLLSACHSGDKETHTNFKEVTVIESEQYEIKPISLSEKLVSHSWSQTCGTTIINDRDKKSFSFDFLAPESDKDEKYCFEFNGQSSNGDTYIDTVIVNVVAPTLEVYIDHASLPTLQQLMHITSTYENKPSNLRFVSWERVALNNEAQKKLNATTYHLHGINTSQELVNAIDSYIQTKNRVYLELYSNTDRSFKNLSPILKKISNKDNVTIKSINLYDDGSVEYIGLYNWKDTPNKIESLTSDVAEIRNYLSGVTQQAPSGMSLRYNWHKLYPTNYFFLRKDYLTIEPRLNDLRNYLGLSLNQMPWGLFNKLTIKNKELFLSIVGFEKELLQEQYNSSKLPNFIFTGTTTWSGGETREFYAKQQVNVVNNAINEDSPIYLGKEYDLFFKGHPRGNDINDMILSSFTSMTNIPSKVSFEVLMMTGMLPDIVSGIASSLYFTIPSDKVGFIVFTSSDTINDREQALNSPLVQVMIKLGIVKESSVLFWADLPNCETGVCISK